MFKNYLYNEDNLAKCKSNNFKSTKGGNLFLTYFRISHKINLTGIRSMNVNILDFYSA